MKEKSFVTLTPDVSPCQDWRPQPDQARPQRDGRLERFRNGPVGFQIRRRGHGRPGGSSPEAGGRLPVVPRRVVGQEVDVRLQQRRRHHRTGDDVIKILCGNQKRFP